MIRIYLADDHTILRAGIRRILSDTSDMELVGEADNGIDVLKAVREGVAVDVLLLDLSLPGRSGMDVLKQLNASHPDLPILILTMHGEDQYAVRLLKAGAAGYVTKESAPDTLLKAIRKVHGGGTYVSEALADRLAFMMKQDTSLDPHESLSDREFQIMLMIATGHKPMEIAKELHISVKTVSTYRSRIFDKMGFESNSDLVQYAVKADLINKFVPKFSD